MVMSGYFVLLAKLAFPKYVYKITENIQTVIITNTLAFKFILLAVCKYCSIILIVG